MAPGTRRLRFSAASQLLENAAAVLLGADAQLPQIVQLSLQRAQFVDAVGHVPDVFVQD